MLRIRQKSIDAFVAAEERAFEQRVARRLRDNFDDLRGETDAALEDLVRRGRVRAAAHGIRSPYGISLYVGLMAHLGEDFDTSRAFPWATDLLCHPHLVPDVRIECVFDHAAELDAAKSATGGAEP